MRKYRTKIIATVVVLAVLLAAWFHGENYTSVGDDMSPVTAQNIETSKLSIADIRTALQTAALSEPKEAEVETQTAIDELLKDSDSITYETASQNESDTVSVSRSESPRYEPITQEDRPVVAEDGSFTVTLSVRADTILNNMHLLREEKHHLVPADGVIFPATVVRVYEGESVFNVLQREMRRAGIHMAFRNTPIYNSAYVMGINNLYEFDVGNLSGWMYKVNGWFPNFGASRYILSPGDIVEWVYSCDLGRDVGGCWLAGGQRDD